MQVMRRKVVTACNYSIPRRGHRRAKISMCWWNDQLSIPSRRKRGGNTSVQRVMLPALGSGNSKIGSEARHKENLIPMLEGPDLNERPLASR